VEAYFTPQSQEPIINRQASIKGGGGRKESKRAVSKEKPGCSCRVADGIERKLDSVGKGKRRRKGNGVFKGQEQS